MKKITQITFLFLLLFSVTSCQLGKSITVRDTVKTVLTSTPDFFQFYDPLIGEGKVKDYNHTILKNEVAPDFEYKFVPSPYKNDEGYFILKPAHALTDTSLSPEGPASGEISIRRSQLKSIEIPQRGN